MENPQPLDQIESLKEKLESAYGEISALCHERDTVLAKIRCIVATASPEEEAEFRRDMLSAVPGGTLRHDL